MTHEIELNGRVGSRRVLRRALQLSILVLMSSGALAVAHADGNWPMYGHDVLGTRFNSSETTLGPGNVSGLHIKWRLATPAPVSATPIVKDNIVYAGDMAGQFYAISSTGTSLWTTTLGGPITASAIAVGDRVVVGDTNGTIYGLKRSSGAVLWTQRPSSHVSAAIWGSGVQIGNNVAFGVASNEEGFAADPGYPCCSFLGSLVLLNPINGAVVWQTSMIPAADAAHGASGASIWSTPAYDPASQTIYVTTGNNFSQPTTLTSDAIIAVDARNGQILWATQLYPNDEWNFRFAFSPEHPDADFGDSPQLYTLPDGLKVVGAGQKSGFYHVLDAATGQVLNQVQLEPGGTLGGLFADTAVANGVVYINGVNWPDTGAAFVGGDLFAVSGDGSQTLWSYPSPTPDMAGVAVANSVVYFTSTWAARLFALDATTGTLLAAPLVGVSDAGPSVSNGQVYVGTGDAITQLFVGVPQTGAIVALGL